MHKARLAMILLVFCLGSRCVPLMYDVLLENNMIIS